MKSRIAFAVTAALLLFAAAAAVAVRGRLNADVSRTGPDVRDTRPATAAERPPSESPDHYEGSMIKWIPVVVPLFAVVLLVAVYFIYAAVL